MVTTQYGLGVRNREVRRLEAVEKLLGRCLGMKEAGRGSSIVKVVGPRSEQVAYKLRELGIWVRKQGGWRRLSRC